jgi:hypothetical protein
VHLVPTRRTRRPAKATKGQRTDDGHHRDVGDPGPVGEGLQMAGGS